MPKTMRGRAWTKDEEAQLARLWEEGVSARDIAERFKRTEWAVLKRAQNLSLHSRKLEWSPEEEEALRANLLILVDQFSEKRHRTPAAVMARLVTMLYDPQFKRYIRPREKGPT